MADTYRAAGTLDLTVHLRDPDVAAKMRPASGVDARYRAITTRPDNALETPKFEVREWNGHAGATVCGRLMLLDELWVRHAPEDHDPTCDLCFGRAPAHHEPTML